MLYIDITRLYNNTRLGKIATGVDKVSLAYLTQFSHQACALLRLPNRWLFFPFKRSQTIFKNLLANKSLKIGYLDKQFYTTPVANQKNFVLNTAHSGLESPNFLKQMHKFNLKGIYFLHDTIPIDYPEYCREGEYQKHFQRLKTMLEAELVIANSQYTADRFEAFCQTYHYQQPNTIWSHIAAQEKIVGNLTSSAHLQLLQLLTQNKPYFVILGTIEARKNHLFLLNLWRELSAKLGENCPKLVIIGKRGWECEQVIDILERSVELKEFVLELNYCQDNEVDYLLDHAQALLFPSYVEGFGLPLIEAFKEGIPVIANDIPVFRELNIGGAELVSTLDGLAWQRLICEYMSHQSNRRLAQLKTIEANRSLIPNWSQHFAEVTPSINRTLNLA